MILEGRSFTLTELKQALIAACGGYINSAYLDMWSWEAWEIIEAIEIVCDLHKDPDEVDLMEILTNGG